MPEGDTVYRTAARLRAGLAGRTLTRSDFRVPRYATVDLTGDPVESVGSYGKHLFIRTAQVSVHTHLKMEGQWHVYPCGRRWTRPRVAARVVLANDEIEAVGFDLGTVEVLPLGDEHRVTDRLGPDLLGADWDPEEVLRRLRSSPDRTIGTALLDQQVLAGIGNIYRSEICFLRRIHPTTPIHAVADLPALVEESRRVLTRAAHQPPWRPLVYRRTRRPCQRCGTIIRSRLLGPDATLTTTPPGPADRILERERAIYYCPHCQPEPAVRGQPEP